MVYILSGCLGKARFSIRKNKSYVDDLIRHSFYFYKKNINLEGNLHLLSNNLKGR